MKAPPSRTSIGLRRLRVFLAVIAFLFVPVGSQADDAAAESEARIRQGVELRKIGRNAEALEEFERAFDLVPTPRARAQVALARQALGDWVGAESGLEEALRATDDPWIATYRDALEGALATVRAHLAWLDVDADAPQAELFLNGVRNRALPLAGALRVAVGSLDVEVRGPGRAPAHRTIHLAAGEERREHFTLELIAPASMLRTGAGTSGAMALSPGAAASPASEASQGGRMVRAYVALAAAGLLAGGGVVAWRVREDRVGLFNNDSRCQQTGGGSRDDQCGGVARDANVALGLEIAAFAGAGMSAVLGALLWRSSSRSPRAALLCVPSGGLAMACHLTF